jgi:hypothetical protein
LTDGEHASLADGKNVVEYQFGPRRKVPKVDLELLPLHHAILAAAVDDDGIFMPSTGHAGGCGQSGGSHGGSEGWVEGW